MTSETTYKDATSPEKDGIMGTEENYFLLLDLNLSIVTFNDAFAKFITVKPGKRSRNIIDCLSSSHIHWLTQMFENAKKGHSMQQEMLINDEQDNVHWIRFDVSPSYNLNNDVVGITCIGNNVDKEKTQEEKIAMQHSLLKEIASTYSHELRHPLTNIMAVINLLKHDNLKMSKLYFECLETASKEMDKVIRTVAMQLYNAA